jgi:putative FmdB family regulatory protein
VPKDFGRKPRLPTYEYSCRSCGRGFEAVQAFTDPPLETCESCGGSLKKVYGAVGIVFKGSGFYKTDSRGSSSKSAQSSGGTEKGNGANPTSETASKTTTEKVTDGASSVKDNASKT